MVKNIEVLKFGGTSLANPDAINQSCSIIECHRTGGTGQVVVVSAMARVTNKLHESYALATQGETIKPLSILDEVRARHVDTLHQSVGSEQYLLAEDRIDQVIGALKTVLQSLSVIRFDHPAIKDQIVPAGEMMNAPVVAAFLSHRGNPVMLFDAGDVIKTDGRFGDANPDYTVTKDRLSELVIPQLADGQVVVIGGYYGRDNNALLNTFGRGGSDRTATILASRLSKLGVEIPGVYLYKADVGGIESADPRIVPTAHVVPHLLRIEAAALSKLGGNVLHPKAVDELRATTIPIICKSTLHPDDSGTVINDEVYNDDPLVKVITALWPLISVKIEGQGMDKPNIAGRVFQLLGAMGINVRAIDQPMTEQFIEIVIPAGTDKTTLTNELLTLIQPDRASGDIQSIDLSEISAVGVIGSGVSNSCVMHRVMETLYHNGDGKTGERAFNIHTGPALCTILYARDEDGGQASQATRALHEELFPEDEKIKQGEIYA